LQSLNAKYKRHPHLQAHEKKLRALQLLLGHAKLESTVRYLDIEVDEPLEIAEETDI
jgi:site-specific recombinase XerC